MFQLFVAIFKGSIPREVCFKIAKDLSERFKIIRKKCLEDEAV
jgi:hypothetical protein